MKQQTYLSVVTCISNDFGNASKFLLALNEYLKINYNNFEIIVVENRNTRDVKQSFDELKKELGGHASVLHLPWKQNIENAMLAGIDLSIGDFVVEIDSPINIGDLSIIHKLYTKCTEGYDIVSARPQKSSDLFSFLYYNFIKKISSINIDLNSEPIRIITRRALNSALRSKEKVRYRQILYLLTGFSNTSITYTTKSHYKSNKNIGEKISLGLEIILTYTDFGLKVTMGMSLFFLLLSFFVGIYAIYIYLTLKQVATGWTTTMLFLSFGFSGFFLITGILTKYLTMVLSETKNRTPYVVQSIEKIK